MKMKGKALREGIVGIIASFAMLLTILLFIALYQYL